MQLCKNSLTARIFSLQDDSFSCLVTNMENSLLLLNKMFFFRRKIILLFLLHAKSLYKLIWVQFILVFHMLTIWAFRMVVWCLMVIQLCAMLKKMFFFLCFSCWSSCTLHLSKFGLKSSRLVTSQFSSHLLRLLLLIEIKSELLLE